MCDCVIGLLSGGYNNQELVTLTKLRERIVENLYYNEVIVPAFSDPNNERFFVRVWQLRDYGDFRKNTNLTRFKHCPNCGKAINWKEIRSFEDVKRDSTY